MRVASARADFKSPPSGKSVDDGLGLLWLDDHRKGAPGNPKLRLPASLRQRVEVPLSDDDVAARALGEAPLVRQHADIPRPYPPKDEIVGMWIPVRPIGEYTSSSMRVVTAARNADRIQAASAKEHLAVDPGDLLRDVREAVLRPHHLPVPVKE
ncbi:hypothetical protein BV20DRAFT_1057957 [Pilatotrama ljubarskyi]|nr:hypothetical protein BV20DRAFT_1057957 [Pilatotrama ljubarskyi]